MYYIRACTLSKIGQIRPWTTELAALERLKIDVTIFSALFQLILFIPTGNDEMNESLEEFEILRDSTSYCGVGCPSASEKIPIDM